MKKSILMLSIISSVLLLSGCATSYTIDQTTYDAMTDFLETSGNEYLRYVENDSTLSKRDKFTKETKYNYFKNLIIEIGK